MNQPQRNRGLQALLLVIVVICGIGSRRASARLPAFVAMYAGDTLWALAAFLGIGFLAPRLSSPRVALAALGISFTVELSQLYHAPWIDAIRRTTLGSLVLGHGFLWSDLLCYSAGVALGWLLELAIRRVAQAIRPTAEKSERT